MAGLLGVLLAVGGFWLGRAAGIAEERQRVDRRLRALSGDLEEVRTAAYDLGSEIARFAVDDWAAVVRDVRAEALSLKSAVDSLENPEGWR